MEGPPRCFWCVGRANGLCISSSAETAIRHSQTDLAQSPVNICLALYFYGDYHLCEAMLFKYLTRSLEQHSGMEWALMLRKMTGFTSQSLKLRDHELTSR